MCISGVQFIYTWPRNWAVFMSELGTKLKPRQVELGSQAVFKDIC